MHAEKTNPMIRWGIVGITRRLRAVSTASRTRLRMDYAMKHKRDGGDKLRIHWGILQSGAALDLRLQVRMQCLDDWLAAQQRKNWQHEPPAGR